MNRQTVLLVFSLLRVIVLYVPMIDAVNVSSLLNTNISSNVSDLKFFYIPSPDKRIEIEYNNLSSLDATNLRWGVKTVVVIDGFGSNSSSPMLVETSALYSSRGDTNVIAVDYGNLSGIWSITANPVQYSLAYVNFIGKVAPVGNRIAEFLNFLRMKRQIQFKDITIVGLSIGAHIAGAAGVIVRDTYKSLLGRIVGLDPAGPFYSLEIREDRRLFKGQASFVDIYHTDIGKLGDSIHDAGDVDIYINGGKNQPGCADADFACSHGYYSYKFFGALFNKSVKACPCNLLFFRVCTCISCHYDCTNGINVGPNINTKTKGRYHVTYGPIN